MAQKQRACDIIGQALRNSQPIKLQKIRRKINFDVQPDEDINRYKQNSFSKVSNDVKDFDVNENSEPTSSSNLDDLNQSKNYLLGDKNDDISNIISVNVAVSPKPEKQFTEKIKIISDEIINVPLSIKSTSKLSLPSTSYIEIEPSLSTNYMETEPMPSTSYIVPVPLPSTGSVETETFSSTVYIDMEPLPSTSCIETEPLSSTNNINIEPLPSTSFSVTVVPVSNIDSNPPPCKKRHTMKKQYFDYLSDEEDFTTIFGEGEADSDVYEPTSESDDSEVGSGMTNKKKRKKI